MSLSSKAEALLPRIRQGIRTHTLLGVMFVVASIPIFGHAYTGIVTQGITLLSQSSGDLVAALSFCFLGVAKLVEAHRARRVIAPAMVYET